VLARCSLLVLVLLLAGCYPPWLHGDDDDTPANDDDAADDDDSAS